MTLLNENRFFSQVLPFIGDPDKMLDELIENAARAGSKHIDIEFSPNKLMAINDGDVLEDWPSLLTIGSTGHKQEVIEAQLPAGMGIAISLAQSTRAIFHSGNKRLEIDCVKYFDSPEYRIEVEFQLINSECLLVDEFVPGFKCEFFQDNGFFKGMVKPTYQDRFLHNVYERFQHYSLKININGTPMGGEEHDWLVEQSGVGQLAGSTVGILKDDFKGQVFWHGKVISCPEIAPFSIVIDQATPVLKPSLPDRKQMSNGKHELTKIKTLIELQLEDDIRLLIEHINDPKCWSGSNVMKYKKAFHIIHKLSFSINLDHFNFWGVVWEGASMTGEPIIDIHIYNIEDSKVFFMKNAMAYMNGIYQAHQIFPPGVHQVSRVVGKCQMPKSAQNIYSEKCIVTYQEDDNNNLFSGEFGDCGLHLCKEIKVNGVDVDYWLDVDNVLYTQHDLNEDAWFDLRHDLMVLFSDSESPAGKYDYEDDWEAMKRAVSGKIRTRDFVEKIYALAGSPDVGINSILLDLPNKEVRVCLGNGAAECFQMDDYFSESMLGTPQE